MKLTRRDTLVLGAAATAVAGLGLPAHASLSDDAIAAFTGGAEVTEGGITLTAPEIAENGNTVPIEVDAPGAKSVMFPADGNPNPAVGTVTFGALAASRTLSTRIRLAQTQDVIAIAAMEDGSFKRTSATVKVTIGGCGG